MPTAAMARVLGRCGPRPVVQAVHPGQRRPRPQRRRTAGRRALASSKGIPDLHDSSMSAWIAAKRGPAVLLPVVALAVLLPFSARSADAPAGAQEAARVRCAANADVTDALKGALAAAKARRGKVVLAADPSGASCGLRESIYISEGMSLIGENSPVVKLGRSGTAFYGDDRSSHFLISRIAIDGSSATSSSAIRLSAASKSSGQWLEWNSSPVKSASPGMAGTRG